MVYKIYSFNQAHISNVQWIYPLFNSLTFTFLHLFIRLSTFKRLHFKSEACDSNSTLPVTALFSEKDLYSFTQDEDSFYVAFILRAQKLKFCLLIVDRKWLCVDYFASIIALSWFMDLRENKTFLSDNARINWLYNVYLKKLMTGSSKKVLKICFELKHIINIFVWLITSGPVQNHILLYYITACT